MYKSGKYNFLRGQIFTWILLCMYAIFGWFMANSKPDQPKPIRTVKVPKLKQCTQWTKIEVIWIDFGFNNSKNKPNRTKSNRINFTNFYGYKNIQIVRWNVLCSYKTKKYTKFHASNIYKPESHALLLESYKSYNNFSCHPLSKCIFVHYNWIINEIRDLNRISPLLVKYEIWYI